MSCYGCRNLKEHERVGEIVYRCKHNKIGFFRWLFGCKKKEEHK